MAGKGIKIKKGSVTIYLAMIFSVLLSLFVTVIEGARNRAVMAQAECAFDLAVYSVFAEYNRVLMEQYDLFFIDTSYGDVDGSEERLKNHLRSYISDNLSEVIMDGASGYADLTKTYLETIDITEKSYATDDQGKVFERQAICYMKQKYGITYLEKIKKEVETAEDNELFTRDVSGERESNQSVIDKAKQEGIATGEVTEDGEEMKEEITLDNPADTVNGNRAKGILLLVTEQNADISEAAVNSNEYVSYEKPGQKGNGLAGRDDISTGETLLFDAYILEKCGNYLEPKEESVLKYEVEYVLFGKNNDVDNLKAAVHRLLLLREVSNVVYLFSDGGKCAEAEALATTICTAAGVPILIEPVKISLLFAWAYAEAIYDVRELLAGGRIPLMKSAKSWHYSLENMLLAGQDSKGAEQNETGQRNQNIADGLSYSDYLRVFLAVSGQEQKVYRMMDVVEMDVRKASNHRQFYLKNCVDYLKIQACVGSKFGYYHEMERTYYYE